jgi:hypothetical protein
MSNKPHEFVKRHHVYVPEEVDSTPIDPDEMEDPEHIERLAKQIWDCLIFKEGPGRTLMAWPACPEAPWCRRTARAVIAAMPQKPDDLLHAFGWTYHIDNNTLCGIVWRRIE